MRSGAATSLRTTANAWHLAAPWRPWRALLLVASTGRSFPWSCWSAVADCGGRRAGAAHLGGGGPWVRRKTPRHSSPQPLELRGATLLLPIPPPHPLVSGLRPESVPSVAHGPAVCRNPRTPRPIVASRHPRSGSSGRSAPHEASPQRSHAEPRSDAQTLAARSPCVRVVGAGCGIRHDTRWGTKGDSVVTQAQFPGTDRTDPAPNLAPAALPCAVALLVIVVRLSCLCLAVVAPPDLPAFLAFLPNVPRHAREAGCGVPWRWQASINGSRACVVPISRGASWFSGLLSPISPNRARSRNTLARSARRSIKARTSGGSGRPFCGR